MCCSSQMVLFDIMFNSILSFLIESGKLFQIEGPKLDIFFVPVCFAKRIFNFRKVISCPYPTM